MDVGSGEGAAPPPQPKNTIIQENNKLLPQHQDTTVINSYSAREYDVNKTLKTLQK